MKEQGGIQLPNDAVSMGYRQVRPFHYEQVFQSEEHSFTGTEKEFIKEGLAYSYRQSGKLTRTVTINYETRI